MHTQRRLNYVVGVMNMNRDDIMRLYSTVHVVVGTPGRINDLSEKGIANLSNCKIVVMDEVRAIVE